MLSRWTDFLHTDGEKEWRKRDEEFENDMLTKADVLDKWNAGWECLLKALESLQEVDLDKVIYIRNQGHTVQEAINRQLGHYAYHVGQIVFLGKMIAGENWASLSIPKGKSSTYNAQKFGQEKNRRHFTDEANTST
jgi:1,2-phenylacetyl-CoA epoxidase catalytic subunit